jgi:ribonuclease Z
MINHSILHPAKNGIIPLRAATGKDEDMSSRQLIALGTSSQVPTRERCHNAYMLRWDEESFLFDPGEGVQRQLTLAGISANSIHQIGITHFHGDHCLGLAGIVQRLSLDRCGHPVHLFYPESGQVYVDRLCSAAIYHPQVELIHHPVSHSGEMQELNRGNGFILMSHELDHGVPTIGFRVEEPPGKRFVPQKLDQAGVRGPMVGELQRSGSIQIGGRTVRLEEVTEPRSGNVFAFVMDTRPCSGAVTLAKDADLLVMEATYTSEHQDIANYYFHSTAADAARTALNGRARRLALTHFSQRYPDTMKHVEEAGIIFPEVIALDDLDRVDIPRRS